MTRPILRHVLPGVLAVLLPLAMPAAIAQAAGPMPGMGGPTEVGVMTLDETEVPFG